MPHLSPTLVQEVVLHNSLKLRTRRPRGMELDDELMFDISVDLEADDRVGQVLEL